MAITNNEVRVFFGRGICERHRNVKDCYISENELVIEKGKAIKAYKLSRIAGYVVSGDIKVEQKEGIRPQVFSQRSIFLN